MSILVIWSLVASLNGAFAAKILLVPGPSTSHCLEMISIGEELLRRGHQVTLYSIMRDPNHCTSKVNMELFKNRFKVVSPHFGEELRNRIENEQIQANALVFERKGMLAKMKFILPMIKSTCDAALADQTLLENVNKEGYNLALVDGRPFMGCLFAVPVLLDIPAVAVGSIIDFLDSRTPLQTNTFPSFLTDYSNNMDFTQRIINTLVFIMNPVFRDFFLPSVDMSLYNKTLARYDTADLVKRSVLFIENSDHIIDYPKAIFPNFVQAGALTANPANPLPADLKTLMDNANDGVIFVTFGSILSGMPEKLQLKVLAVLDRLTYAVIYKQDQDGVRGRVRMMKWVPQNDILGHPNTKLFISHCGKNSFWESVYHGVPIICMAIHAETHTTSVKVIKHGIGSSINIFDDSVDELVEIINGVLSNETIKKNMKLKAILLRDRPETPRQRAASAIEHVLKYGGDHMRPPSVDFGFLSYASVDIWCIIFLFVWVNVSFNVWITRKCCCKRKFHKTKID